MFCLNFNCKLTLMFELIATIRYPVYPVNCFRLNPVSGKVVSGTSYKLVEIQIPKYVRCHINLLSLHRLLSIHLQNFFTLLFIMTI